MGAFYSMRVNFLLLTLLLFQLDFKATRYSPLINAVPRSFGRSIIIIVRSFSPQNETRKRPETDDIWLPRGLVLLLFLPFSSHDKSAAPIFSRLHLSHEQRERRLE